MRNNETTNEIDEIKKWEENITRKDLKYETKKCTIKYETARSFADSIYARKANIINAEENHRNMFKNIVEFNDKSRPRSREGKYKKRDA